MADNMRVFHASDAADKTVKEGPYGWIQWKGTQVCIDLYCSCGACGHLDVDFMYQVKCESCGQHYAVGKRVVLAPMSAEDAAAEMDQYPGTEFYGFKDLTR
ncbi:Uncharacterised protein [Mycobacteroides abscessus subsp. bolletii]|uniref:hypothetical protein n=1 Tax=Mycobacteroides abscessus TaxID=36809 RepID=UPI0009A792CD|nr:hypothetical protein [Mycobacteroides abscessus]SKX81211.1 Uncharacterised protein [Mycobacteroides abscessus subsp. bolletii]